MLQSRGCWIACVLIILSALTIAPTVNGKSYQGFQLLNQDECAPLDKKTVLQLPEAWHKYADFVKICGLRQKKGQTAKVSIISIWADDYLNAQPADPKWEQFPLPLVIDHDLRQVGQLPELYPTHQAHELKIYYGKWQAGIPAEIRLHVYNPAAYGDFDYTPLIWNRTTGRYETKSKEVRHGVGH